jgi:hypothetical protein
MTEEPSSLILELLRQMRAELGDVRSDVGDARSDISQIRADMVTQADLASLRGDVASDMHTLRADVAADLLTTRKELGEQIAALRQTVIDYHAMALHVCPSLLRFRASAAAQQHDGVGS